MSLSHAQLQELDKYQQKFLNGEITAKEYEFAKAEILNWENEEPVKEPKKQGFSGNFNVSKKDTGEQEDDDEDPLIGNIVYLIVVFIFSGIKSLFSGIFSIIQKLHAHILKLGKSKGFSHSKTNIILAWAILLIMWVVVWKAQYIQYQEESIKIQQEEQMLAKEQTEDKRIAEEKANTPKPSIVILSSMGNQGKKMEYVLQFTATGADTVTLNSERIEQNGSGVYEKQLTLESWETNLTIIAKNKYFSDTRGFIISREKTDAEIQAEKEAEAKALEEQRQAEIRAEEERKQAEEEKRQQLEVEKGTYSTISYAKLSKNPDKYKGERIKFKWKIFHAEEEGTNSAFQINTDGYGIDNQILTLATWSNDYAEWDWVTIWGVVMGETCYTSQAGWNICVPSVKANIIE